MVLTAPDGAAHLCNSLRDEQHSVTAGITRKVKATGSSSVPSLARWGHELFSGRVIQPRSLCQMARFHLGAIWEAYGLGPRATRSTGTRRGWSNALSAIALTGES
jgi:hypothetical protein